MEINSINMIKRVKHLPIKLLFFLAPFTVSGFFQNLTPIIETSLALQLILFLYFFIFILNHQKISFNKFEIHTLILFVTPIAMSFIGVFSKILLNSNISYYEYINSDLKNRVVLVILNLTILVGLLKMTHDWTREKTYSLIKKYYNGLFVFVMVGVWQLAHFLFGIPFININTRSYVHSVSSVEMIMNQRLTSLANEPSYLAPLVIDFIILSFLLSKKPKIPVVIGLIVLMFSYSGGGYLDLLLLLITFAITKVKYEGIKSSININKILKILIISFIVIILILNYNTKLYEIFIPIIGRMESFFDIKSHVRLFLVVMPFVWVTKESFFNLNFGYGPGSYKYLNLTEFLPTGEAVHKTSNNIFSDTVYETGYLGLIMYIVLFIKLIYTPFKNVHQNRDYFFATMFSVHLMVTSLYRADYMQIRFWILIFIIFKLMRFAKMKGLE